MVFKIDSGYHELAVDPEAKREVWVRNEIFYTTKSALAPLPQDFHCPNLSAIFWSSDTSLLNEANVASKL